MSLFITIIAIALQELPAEALQERFGKSATAPGCIAEQNNGRATAAIPAVVGGNGPEEAFLRSSSPGIEHRRGGLVHEDAVGRGKVLAHVVGDRLEVEARSTHPVAESSPVKLDALPGIDLGLPIKGQVIAELRDNDLGDQPFRWQPSRHDMFGRMRLHDRA